MMLKKKKKQTKTTDNHWFSLYILYIFAIILAKYAAVYNLFFFLFVCLF